MHNQWIWEGIVLFSALNHNLTFAITKVKVVRWGANKSCLFREGSGGLPWFCQESGCFECVSLCCLCLIARVRRFRELLIKRFSPRKTSTSLS